jgi:hypothetical protein
MLRAYIKALHDFVPGFGGHEIARETSVTIYDVAS